MKKIPPLLVALMFAASSFGQNVQPGLTDDALKPENGCPAKSLLLSFDVQRFGEIIGQAPIWHLPEQSAFFFTAGLAIDADGAPNAYNGDNTGLDDLSNAGEPGHWNGILQDAEGNPLVQGSDDPFPGYYISCTALADRTKALLDPTRFVDASKIPYIALPGDLARETGARLGDVAVAFNLRNGRYSFAIFADIGTLGEGSIALADNLGIWSDARRGGSRGGIAYLVFPGSGDHRPKSVEDINELGAELLEGWGGAEQIRDCADHRNGERPSWFAPLLWSPLPNQPEGLPANESKPPGDTASGGTTNANTP